MPVPNPTMPVKGAGTTLWVYKGNGDPYANPLSDVDWSRLAKVKDLTPGELTAESYDDSYLDDEDADWTATGQGQKSAGDTSFTLAWMPGEQGQQALLAWFNEGDTRAYKIRFPNGTVDVFRGWVSSIGKAVTAKEVITRTVKVTGMAEDLQSLVGGTVVRRKVYARFLDAVNFVNGNSDADPEQEVISRWRIEQCSELSAVSASFVLSTPTETDGAVFPGRIMLANTCTWTYRGDECGYHGPAVADEYDQPTSDITKDKCSKCLSGCKFRNNVGNFGGFLSINKLSQ